MIVADTGALVALIDADDAHHAQMRDLYGVDPQAWILPWAILPEVDYLVGSHVGRGAQHAWLADLADGLFTVEWGVPGDFDRALALTREYADLDLGLVDGIVIAVAERIEAEAIATLDLRDFGAVRIAGNPRLLPRDLP